ncbi:hypothetical protein LTR53_014635 [Teratosphaeriaceae sp. CCFEE 6253]|nr:hypothetical protein LTR53_014635 [Teratosphaeriaceae sp. CCFEE 6253]
MLLYTVSIRNVDSTKTASHAAEEERINTLWHQARTFLQGRADAAKAAKDAEAMGRIHEVEAADMDESEDAVLFVGKAWEFKLGDWKSKHGRQMFAVEFERCSDLEARGMMEQLVELSGSLDGTVEFIAGQY